MHEMQTAAINDPEARAFVTHAGNCSYSFARCRHFDEAIAALL